MTATTSAADTVRTWRLTHPWPGEPYPLGSTYTGEGTNFAVYSEHARGVDLCLFDPDDAGREVVRFNMREQTDYVWHVFIPGVAPGTRYGYRVYGDWAPEHGLLFNPLKVLVDPYAKALHGLTKWDSSMYGFDYAAGGARKHHAVSTERNDHAVPKSVVIDEHYDWGDDRPVRIPTHRTVIYELHVRGYSALNPAVPEELRGTYAGLAHPASIQHLLDLGVTTVELMPVHQFVQDHRLEQLGLRNYWGYNTLSYFAPHNEYAYEKSGDGPVREFKDLVRALHAAGLEVILDVVYNHTGEGDHLGPTYHFKGIDNAGYYRLNPADRSTYTDYTGTGNTLDLNEPRVLQLVMDSLRYWVIHMHVDGFRFDLASALARGLYEVGKLSTFLDTIHQDPVLSQVKLIAEPWDVGPGGYQVGNFPVKWAEWNGKYRDCVRSFWKGDEAKVPELAYRLTGSSDLYEHNGRRPTASINFVTSHDGFTLRDLVSYNDKHNHANGEANRDGDSHNESWNCGAEGPTDDAAVEALRAQQQRNLLATLLLSQGVPMISMGDECGRTQLGNNNAYCQDNALSYMQWTWTPAQATLHAFVRDVLRVRRENPILHRRRFFTGRPIHGSQVSDILWITPQGTEMSEAEWHNGTTRCLGMLLNGEAMDEYDERGIRLRDDIFLLLVNSHWQAIDFELPGNAERTDWRVVVDTVAGEVEPVRQFRAHESMPLPARSLLLLCRTPRSGSAAKARPWALTLREAR